MHERNRSLTPRALANRLRNLVIVTIVVSMLGSALPIEAAAADLPPAPYNCVRDGLLLRSYIPCEEGDDPPDLINPALLDPALAPGDQLYVATTEQREAIDRLQEEAIRNVMLQHQLPLDDYDAVKSWARGEVIAEMWLLVAEAVNTWPSDRSWWQKGVASWTKDLYYRMRLSAREQAALEYARFAGIDPAPLQAALDTPGGPTHQQVIDALAGQPYPFTAHGGYCNYEPPAGQGGYEGQHDPTCVRPCTTPLGCPPPTPDSQSFLIWGQAAALSANISTVDMVQAAMHAYSALAYPGIALYGSVVGIQAGLAAADAATKTASIWFTAVKNTVPFAIIQINDYGVKGAALAAGATDQVASIAPSVVQGAGQATEQTAVVATGTVTAGTAAIVSAILFVITTAITEGLELGETLEKPEQMANAVVGGHNAVEIDLYQLMRTFPEDTDIGKSMRSTTMQTLFWTLMGAFAPEPFTGTACDNVAVIDVADDVTRPCLNATQLHAPTASDPVFQITRRDGQGQSRHAPTINLKDPVTGVLSEIGLTGNWWLGSSRAPDGVGADWQSLKLVYNDWDNVERAVWSVSNAGRTSFVEYTPGPMIDPDTRPLDCRPHCRPVDELHYTGADGVQYIARVVPPSPDTTRPRMSITPVPERVTTPLRGVTATYSEDINVAPVFELRRDGVLVRRITKSDLVILPADGLQWDVPLRVSDVTPQGQYTFTVINQGLTDVNGNPIVGGNQSVTWYMDERPTGFLDLNGSLLPAGHDLFTATFTEPVSRVDVTDFELIANGQRVDLELAGIDVDQVDARSNRFTLSGFAPLLNATGHYQLRFAADSDIVDVTANKVIDVATLFDVAGQLTLSIDPIGNRTEPLDQVTLRFSEPVGGVELASLHLVRDAVPVDLAGAVVAAQPGSQVFEVRGLEGATAAPGHYQLIVDAAGPPMVTQSGSMLAAPVTTEFDVLDTAVPTSSTTTTTTTTTTTVPEQTTTTTSTTTTVPEQTTTTTTSLPEETTSTSSTTTVPETTPTVPEPTTTSTTTSTTTVPASTSTTSTTSTTTVPATTSTTTPPQGSLPPRQPGGSTPVTGNPRPPSHHPPAPVMPAPPRRPADRPVPRTVITPDRAERSIAAGIVSGVIGGSSGSGNGPRLAASAAPTPGGNETAPTIASGSTSGTGGRGPSAASSTPFVTQWWALIGAIVSALIGSWYAFHGRAARAGGPL